MKQRLASLDWLRGLLATSIMIYHLTLWEVAALDSSSTIGRLGVYGVSMFFVLSGLSIALVYRRFLVWQTVPAFMIRRLFRIWPLMWLAIIAVSWMNAISGDPPSWKLVLLNLTTLFGFISPISYINSGAWSIGNEMVYYALTPLIVILYNRSRLAGNLLTLATIVVGFVFSSVLLSPDAALADQWVTYINPFNNLFLYCCGVAICYNADKLVMSQAWCFTCFAVALAIFVLHPVTGDHINIVTGWNRAIFCAACVLCVLAFYKNRYTPARYIAVPLTELGMATYSVYLLHPVFWQALHSFGARVNLDPGPGATIAIVIVLTLLLAWLCYRSFEEPLMNLGKRLTSQAASARGAGGSSDVQPNVP
jgi:peptidoglycan/LPS O-acetylase OafA/YrhL